MPDKHIFYKRKSQDSEDRQILSLESQNNAITEAIPNFKSLDIVKDYQESRSAKAPGRPLFNEMCERLEAGEANFIICWQLNRLARNPVDGGRIIWLVQNNGVKIITPSKTYDSNDILLMYVEFAMSNQFITDLSKNTLRGLSDKVNLGHAPTLAPIGYLNDVTKRQGERDIIVDPERFPLVRKMWDMLLSGNYTPAVILEKATDEWGLRMKNGTPLSRSGVYRLFSNIFYTGKFLHNEQIYDGKHTAMVTEEEFDKAQRILGLRGKPGLWKHDFAFTGLIKCVCGSGITAHERFRKICPSCHYKFNAQRHQACPSCSTTSPEATSYYCYYHCTKKKNPACKQPAVSKKDLESQIDKVLAQISIPKDFVDWTLKMLRKTNDEETTSRQVIESNLQGALNAVTRKLDNLLRKYLSDENTDGSLISDKEYKQQKLLLQEEKYSLEEQLKAYSVRQDSWLDTAEKTFNFAVNARYWFAKGYKDTKRTILNAIGLNLKLDNKILLLELAKPYDLIGEAAILLNKPYERIEPAKQADTARNINSIEYDISKWGG